MINEKNTAIITCIDNNYERNLADDFLESLRNIALYNGKVIVVDYGINKEYKNRIKENYDVEIYEYEKVMPVFVLRYRHIPEIIRGLPDNITNILIIDGGDVWFQKSIMPIFELTKEKIGCVEESIAFNKNNRENKWASMPIDILSDSIYNKIKEYINEKTVKNAGMVCGPKNQILNVFVNIYEDIKESGIECFGLSQLFFNYEFNKLNEEQKVLLESKYNYVLVTNKDKYKIKDNKFYDESNTLITVVHNAGGKWRVIKERNESKNDVDEQYSKNIRDFVGIDSEKQDRFTKNSCNEKIYTFNELIFDSNIGVKSCFIKDNCLNIDYEGQYEEIKFNFPHNIDLSNVNSIIIKGLSKNGQTAIKFYDINDEDAFVMYNNKCLNFSYWIENLDSIMKSKTIKSIGIMSQDNGKCSAIINYIVFK